LAKGKRKASSDDEVDQVSAVDILGTLRDTDLALPVESEIPEVSDVDRDQVVATIAALSEELHHRQVTEILDYSRDPLATHIPRDMFSREIWDICDRRVKIRLFALMKRLEDPRYCRIFYTN
jgi:hypothetical protein